MKVKRGLLYTASHEWVDFMPNGTARVGISDFVPQKRGKISFLNLCDEGEYYQSGEVIGDAEAFKGDYYICPVCGYTHEGPMTGSCPVCGAKGANFIKVD